MRSTRGKAATHKEPSRPVDPVIYALRKKRIQLGLPAYAVAERLGYAEDTIRRCETGRGVPNFKIVQNWAQALGMKLELVEE